MQLKKLPVLLVCALSFGIAHRGSAVEDGLLVDYRFSEKEGSAVRDSSGRGNDGVILGGATRVKGLPFGALSFNGKDALVEGPKDLPITDRGTLEFWCYPRKFGGGLISWGDGGWERLGLKYDIYFGNRLEGDFSNGKFYLYFFGEDMPADVKNRWSHMVMRFDPKSVDFFRNGRYQCSRPMHFAPDISGLSMQIGATRLMRGRPFFDGMMAGVKVYNRTLTNREIKEHFDKDAALFQPHHPAPPLAVTPRFSAKNRQLAVVADVADFGIRSGRLTARLYAGTHLLQTASGELKGGAGFVQADFDGSKLTARDYEIRSSVTDGGGAITATGTTRWRLPQLGATSGRLLNNLVAELAQVKNTGARTIEFVNPRNGFVYFSCSAQMTGNDAVSVTIAGQPATTGLQLKAGGPASAENMCYLPAGPGRITLTLTGKPSVREVVVRSVPELMGVRFPLEDPPTVSINHRGTGHYDFPFLQKAGFLDNFNTIAAAYGGMTVAILKGNDPSRPQAWFDKWNSYDTWKKKGRRWLLEADLPNLLPSWDFPNSGYRMYQPVKQGEVFDYIARGEGFTDPNFSGTMLNEFTLGSGYDAPAHSEPYVDSRYLLPAYTGALRRIAAEPRFRDRTAYIYSTSLERAISPDTHEFVTTALAAGSKFVWEDYMSQPPTAEDGRSILSGNGSGWSVNNVRLAMERSNTLFPGLADQLLVAPGIYSTPNPYHAVDPNLDYKVWLDMQMQYFATSPEFFGLAGIAWYPMHQADEEILRWVSLLHRHYAIEGRTDLLSPRYGFNWKPNIVRNSDFDDGKAGWTIGAAEAGSVREGALDDLGMMQGRFRRNEMGRHYLLTKRSSLGPNTVSQTMRNLVPGKLYSVKLRSTDYQAFQNGGEGPPLGLEVSVEGMEALPEKTIIMRAKSEHDPTRWFDSHRLVFRARSKTAKLTISDWKDGKPAGPIGQETLFNYAAVIPYLGDAV